MRRRANSGGRVPDIHVPHLDDHGVHPTRRRHSVLKLLLEVSLISAGVFLGLMGEQWREARVHHELAEAALRNFESEMRSNRKAVVDVTDYHIAMAGKVRAYLRSTE